MQTCRSCGAPIKWGKTPNGRRMPLDAEPQYGGASSGRLLLDTSNGSVRVIVQDEDVPDETPTYVSHFATCPSAAKHRKAR